MKRITIWKNLLGDIFPLLNGEKNYNSEKPAGDIFQLLRQKFNEPTAKLVTQ